ncbi:hypothetical protein [Castellaniella defragrans]|uniref:hypothetical protein n=1 Tax=Castellaniella defragrans TaxID=75697 RepID=UPI002AFF149C|nr:hypothetical protein [Castellaniella defragrans]
MIVLHGEAGRKQAHAQVRAVPCTGSCTVRGRPAAGARNHGRGRETGPEMARKWPEADTLRGHDAPHQDFVLRAGIGTRSHLYIFTKTSFFHKNLSGYIAYHHEKLIH